MSFGVNVCQVEVHGVNSYLLGRSCWIITMEMYSFPSQNTRSLDYNFLPLERTGISYSQLLAPRKSKQSPCIFLFVLLVVDPERVLGASCARHSSQSKREGGSVFDRCSCIGTFSFGLHKISQLILIGDILNSLPKI
jgi:hypothetical protein